MKAAPGRLGVSRSISSQIKAEEIMPQSQEEETYQPFLMFAEPLSAIRSVPCRTAFRWRTAVWKGRGWTGVRRALLAERHPCAQKAWR
ncbi:hypothetical protein [Brenneria goodwinii]|uniref:hypothetical protein n=1 Tax=Brenneria goodwinii TaxID=1109412 RepID=UPI0036DFD48B